MATERGSLGLGQRLLLFVGLPFSGAWAVGVVTGVSMLTGGIARLEVSRRIGQAGATKSGS